MPRERERETRKRAETHKNTPRLATPSDSVSRRRVELDPAAPPRHAPPGFLPPPAIGTPRESPDRPGSLPISRPPSLSPPSIPSVRRIFPRERRARALPEGKDRAPNSRRPIAPCVRRRLSPSVDSPFDFASSLISRSAEFVFLFFCCPLRSTRTSEAGSKP